MPWDIWDVCVRCMSGVFFLVYVQCASIVSGWWFGTFFHILGIAIPTDELIFFKMVKTTNQVCNDEFFLSVPRQWSGPVFIKLGQWLSTRRDIIPSHFLLAKSPRSRTDLLRKFSKPCSGWLIVVFIGYKPTMGIWWYILVGGLEHV